jgi:hypothetical protein
MPSVSSLLSHVIAQESWAHAPSSAAAVKAKARYLPSSRLLKTVPKSGNKLLAQDGDDAIRVAANTVYHNAATPSFIELPVLTT